MEQIGQWVFFAGFLILAAVAAVLAMYAIHQHRLSRIAALHRLALEHADDPILILDAQTRVTDLNAACQRLIGSETTTIVGQPVAQAWPAWATQLKQLDSNTELRKEILLEVSGQTHVYAVHIVPVAGQHTQLNGRIAIMRNLTPLREMEKAFISAQRETETIREQGEREKQALQEQLTQARKLEAIGALAGGIAHDFNNLLTAIQGNATLARGQIELDDPIYLDLQEIELACQRASRLTRQLLLFSRKQPIEPAVLDLNTAVQEMTHMLERLIGEDVTMQVELGPDLWAVEVDKGGIEQVTINLVVNARDAMPLGGEITIQTENVVLTEADCYAIPEACPGQFVRISVADTGIGMDDQVIEHLFEPFFSTKEAGQGTGLGLAVIYGIIRQHEGWVQVDSALKEGSTFSVYLPAATQAPQQESDGTISLEGLEGRGERILLVEDEKSVLEFGVRVLGQYGYAVFDASSAQEALEILDREEWRFDLVFSDVVLPDKSGLDLADLILAQHPSLRILLSSGYTGRRSQWDTIRDRGFKFLQKPLLTGKSY